MNNKKVLYFEGAGWSGADISKATVGNCRIRTAFHLDNGKAVYLEIIASTSTKTNPPYYTGWVESCHYITGSSDDCNCSRIKPSRTSFEYNHAEILRFVNSLGCSFDSVEVVPDLGGYRVTREDFRYRMEDYNWGDQFRLDRDLLAAREAVDAYILEQERRLTGRKWPAYSLWVDETDPAILHFNSHCGRKYCLCVAPPKTPDSLPGLTKENAVPGCFYAFGASHLQLHEIYRITNEEAAANDLMYLDRVKTSIGDFAVPGSDVYQKGGC